MTSEDRAVRAVVLVIAGVLMFSDVGALAVMGQLATVVTLVAIGVAEARMRAVAWALLFPVSALIADILWQLDVAPFDRSEEYEAIPQTPFAVLGLPIPMLLVAIGVLVAWGLRRRRRPASSA